MEIKEIKAKDLDASKFIKRAKKEIAEEVSVSIAINALSGGVDSSAVTMLGHMALDELQFKTCFVDNGLMRKGEPERIIEIFKSLGVNVELINAQDEFLKALEGITDPEEKREAVTQTFYKKVFRRIVGNSGANCLFQGTILTDVDETVAGIKRQHNVFSQIGIDPQKAFGYKIIEPLLPLRKDGVRKLAKALGLPEEIYNRPPFPGPGLAARIIGPVTKEKIELVREATAITEEILSTVEHFQSMTILHKDKVTGIVDEERKFGNQIQIRCWKSTDARTAEPMAIPYEVLFWLGEEIPKMIPEVVNVVYGITRKPPVTMEAL